MRPTLAIWFVMVMLFAAGCGSGRSGVSISDSKPASTAPDGGESLDAAARAALRQNYELSLYVLWNNVLPSSASRSTRGPALASLSSSAKGRKNRGIHIRVLDRKFTIVSLTLDPSYTRAIATIQSRQHVRPYRNGKPSGRAIELNERAHITLHRLDGEQRFVVWKVSLA